MSNPPRPAPAAFALSCLAARLAVGALYVSGALVAAILLLAALGGGGAFAYIKFIKPKQGAKVSADPDDYEFEDEEYENEDVPEQGEQEDQN